ncbi:MAG: hypothetical protein BroJett029_06540 [Alphaproteobacteria bacterium]|nr:MAG: hypothetical protein BroJett029_06540 [Alphaproteobacteria bacterium]
MKVAFYGSSLLSSYWNGAATYYRGLIKALARLGYRVTFYEPRAFGRHDRSDMTAPPWCDVVIFSPTLDGVRAAASEAAKADVVIKASGVGVFDDEILALTMSSARLDALKIWWDVDAPATLAELRESPDAPLRHRLPELDAVLTYGGGQAVIDGYKAFGARECQLIYNGFDPDDVHPVPPDPRFEADLGFLGNRLPDREARVESFFFAAARQAPAHRFLLGGAGWEPHGVPYNVQLLGHVPTADHNAFNCTARAVLNINRQSMAEYGFSPPTRVFEAAGAGACLITDDWPGIDSFLSPGEEILVARDGQDVADCVKSLSAEEANRIGARARARMLAEHSYDRRATVADALIRRLLSVKRAEAAA